MKPEFYRKKPVVIEAMQFTDETFSSVLAWLNSPGLISIEGGDCIFIETLEGNMRADKGDWIIKGVKGEFYPCKPDIFEATYERAAAAALRESGDE